MVETTPPCNYGHTKGHQKKVPTETAGAMCWFAPPVIKCKTKTVAPSQQKSVVEGKNTIHKMDQNDVCDHAG